MGTQQIRTISQILAGFPDNTSRLIRPEDSRNLTISAFPALEDRDPDLTDDRENTSGAGFFDACSRWVNTTNKTFWVCFDGTAHAADWRQVYPAPVPTPVVLPFLVRLTSDGAEVPLLKKTGIVGHATFPTMDIDGVDPSDIDSMEPGMLVGDNGAFPVGTIITKLFRGLGIVSVSNPATSGGDITFSVTPLAWEWVAQAFDPVTGANYDNPDGPTGTVSTGPAFEINRSTNPHNGDFVFIYRRNVASDIPTWSFSDDGLSSRGGSIGSPTQAEPVIINYYGDTTNTTEIHYGDNVYLFFDPTWITMTFPWPPSSGGTGSTGFSPDMVIVSDSSGNLTTIGAMGDGQLVIGASGFGPTVGSITSVDSSVVITVGPGTIDLSVSAGPGGGMVGLDDAGTATTTAATVLHISGGNGMLGTWDFKNTGSNSIRLTIQITDQAGNVNSTIATVSAGTTNTVNIGRADIFFGGFKGLMVDVLVTAFTFTGTSTWQTWGGFIS